MDYLILVITNQVREYQPLELRMSTGQPTRSRHSKIVCPVDHVCMESENCMCACATQKTSFVNVLSVCGAKKQPFVVIKFAYRH
jgi:hypothetical protein